MSLSKKIEFIRMVSQGYQNNMASWWINHGKKLWEQSSQHPAFTLKEYLSLYPVNGLYGKWLIDKNLSSKVYQKFSEFFPKRYFLIYQRRGKLNVININKEDSQSCGDLSQVIPLIKREKALYITKTRGISGITVTFDEEKGFTLDGNSCNESDLFAYFSTLKGIALVEEKLYQQEANPIIRLVCTRNDDGDLVISQGWIKKVSSTDDASEKYVHTKEIDDNFGSRPYRLAEDKDMECKALDLSAEDLQHLSEIVKTLGQETPHIIYCGMDIYQTEAGYKIMDMTDFPAYPLHTGFNQEVQNYLSQRLSQSREGETYIVRKKISTVFWMLMAKAFSKLPMRPLVFKEYFTLVKKDFLSRNGQSISKKIKAYRWGFLSYRIAQYGITEKNRKAFISDQQYAYLKHINTKYRTMLEDKMTIKYICQKYNQFLPEYYYLVSGAESAPRLIPLMDCDAAANSTEAFFALVKEKKVLACKPQRGSHGVGFIKLAYRDGQYWMNEKAATIDEIKKRIFNPTHQYLITEYIQSAQVLKKIYPGAVNTMRIIVYRNAVGEYKIGNAYLRFGTDTTGGVDNMGAGGMFAAVDIDSGRIFDGKTIKENVISPCPIHPDTKEKIEGMLPHWSQTKKDILSMCETLPELEYLGFDVAITDDGMKIPEINRAPEYPMIEKLSKETNDHLLKLFKEKRRK